MGNMWVIGHDLGGLNRVSLSHIRRQSLRLGQPNPAPNQACGPRQQPTGTVAMTKYHRGRRPSTTARHGGKDSRDIEGGNRENQKLLRRRTAK